MRCDKCGYANEAEAKFCNQCGTTLRRPCAHCGAANVPGSRFCKECGRELAAAPSPVDLGDLPPQMQPQAKKVCSACRTVNESASAYCYNCGVALPPSGSRALATLGNPAGFWVRAAAYVIDNLLVSLFTMLSLILLSAGETSEVWDELFGGRFGPAAIVNEGLLILYFTFATARWGHTLGKAFFRLQVTRKDGTRLTYWRSFARYWSYYLSFITLFVGFLMIALTSHKRALHDYVCDTRVIRIVR